MTCKNCGYHYIADGEPYARCHFDEPDGLAPCVQEESTYEIEYSCVWEEIPTEEFKENS